LKRTYYCKHKYDRRFTLMFYGRSIKILSAISALNSFSWPAPIFYKTFSTGKQLSVAYEAIRWANPDNNCTS